MKTREGLRVGVGCAAMLLSACALQPRQLQAPPPQDECEAMYAELDERVAAAGVADAGETRIAGFPYLRANRFTASFNPPANGVATVAWMRSLAALDLNARKAEIQNLLSSRDARTMLTRVQACSAKLMARDLASPARRKQLMAAVHVPSSYSSAQRALGLYPLTSALLRKRVQDDHAEVIAEFEQPLAEPVPPAKLLRWQPRRAPQVKDSRVARWLRQRDALGVPQLVPEEWRRIAERHAPVWWLETRSAADVPGEPLWTQGGISVDTRQPVVYYKPGFARWQGRVLPQISYHLWFSARPAEGALDPYAGTLDGLIWRVTLDEQGRTLVYDSIHACGCYPMYFPAQALTPRAVDESVEPPLVPQQGVPADAVALRVVAGTHALRRIVPEHASAGESFMYRLIPYDELRSLPMPDGSYRSLFSDCGLVAGTQRNERFWLWPSGVVSPGAMRQWGHHATAFVGERHFDAPDDLERVFALP